jgi:gamma-glutamyltranspeptidase/glutathione hydrolase
MKGLYLLLFTFLVFACTNRTSETRTTGVLADSAMVVSAHPLASQIGVNIMKKGGN